MLIDVDYIERLHGKAAALRMAKDDRCILPGYTKEQVMLEINDITSTDEFAVWNRLDNLPGLKSCGDKDSRWIYIVNASPKIQTLQFVGPNILMAINRAIGENVPSGSGDEISFTELRQIVSRENILASLEIASGSVVSIDEIRAGLE